MNLSSLWTNDRTTALVVGASSFLVLIIARYRAAIRKRLGQLNVLRIVRTSDTDETRVNPKMKQVELNPDFVKQCSQEGYPRMISLGDYLSSLRPSNGHLPDFLDTALQNAITRALLKGLGNRVGKALLPILGTSFFQDAISKLVTEILAHFATRHERVGAVPLPLSAIPGVAQLNFNVQKSRGDISVDAQDWETSPKSSINLLRGGEVGYKPSFSEVVTPPASKDDLLVPNPFIISKHWDRAITKMEDLLVAAGDDTKWKTTPMEDCDDEDQQGTPTSGTFVYDAQSKSMKTPIPIDETLLPDLHLGWGSAPCTHTHQEILKNRLLAVLLNRLASNYFYTNEPLFQVYMDESSKPMTRPTELMQALVDMGHSVESCVRSNVTTFGVALCVKEQDDSFTNIPLAVFMHNGFNDKDGNEAYAFLPHSGLNVEIRGGPLLQHASIQHYIAIEGEFVDVV